MENLVKLNLNNNEIIYTDELYQNKSDAITVRNVDFINLHRLSYLLLAYLLQSFLVLDRSRRIFLFLMHLFLTLLPFHGCVFV